MRSCPIISARTRISWHTQGYTDAWNHIPTDTNGTLEYLNLGRMYLYDGTYHKVLGNPTRSST
eukprot:COSAG05_NODE_1668_length_4309_cov_3.260570_1_plen_63_part_00